MASAALKTSVDEFLVLPEVDGIKRGLLDGEIVEVPMCAASEPREAIKAESSVASSSPPVSQRSS